MFTVRADSIGEFINNLRLVATENIGNKVAQIDLNAKGGQAEAQALSAVRQQFPDAQVVSNGPGQSYEPPWQDAGPQTGQQYPPASQELPGAVQRRCNACNAPAEYKEGTSRAGKPYKGYFCTANRDHSPQWVS